jgi:hypothetical protein
MDSNITFNPEGTQYLEKCNDGSYKRYLMEIPYDISSALLHMTCTKEAPAVFISEEEYWETMANFGIYPPEPKRRRRITKKHIKSILCIVIAIIAICILIAKS